MRRGCQDLIRLGAGGTNLSDWGDLFRWYFHHAAVLPHPDGVPEEPVPLDIEVDRILRSLCLHV